MSGSRGAGWFSVWRAACWPAARLDVTDLTPGGFRNLRRPTVSA